MEEVGESELDDAEPMVQAGAHATSGAEGQQLEVLAFDIDVGVQEAGRCEHVGLLPGMLIGADSPQVYEDPSARGYVVGCGPMCCGLGGTVVIGQRGHLHKTILVGHVWDHHDRHRVQPEHLLHNCPQMLEPRYVVLLHHPLHPHHLLQLFLDHPHLLRIR